MAVSNMATKKMLIMVAGDTEMVNRTLFLCNCRRGIIVRSFGKVKLSLAYDTLDPVRAYGRYLEACAPFHLQTIHVWVAHNCVLLKYQTYIITIWDIYFRRHK